MMSTTSSDPETDQLLSLERTINTAGLPHLVELLGGLERLKAILWQRLVSVTTTRAAPLATDPVEELRHLTPQQVAEILSLSLYSRRISTETFGRTRSGAGPGDRNDLGSPEPED
jgi:hypothetical protein